MSLSALDLTIAGGATLVSGAINALAGGGTLVSFPALVAIGVPALPANVTNTVALCPGYFSGSWAQREDLRPQRRTATWLAGAAAIGGLGGSVLLVLTPGSAFRAAVPWLILLSCALLLSQDRVRAMVKARTSEPSSSGSSRPALPLLLAICAGGVYGGFFGAGLGIMLLALLGLWLDESMVRINALKQAISLVVNSVAAVFFAFSGHVRWEVVPVMAVAALVGGTFGGRLIRIVNPIWLRRAVVLFGVAVAIDFWVTH